jgi:hypothetical protein
MTAFRRRVRHHQATWREAHGHPIGTLPMNPKPGHKARPVGSRLPLEYARTTGANFLTPQALGAVNARLERKEPNQSLDRSHLWADLLWSLTLAFNLFGDIAADLELADRVVHQLWPDAPGTVSEVRFEHSPGWLDADYIGNLSSFATAFVLDRDDGSRGVIGVVTPYHDQVRREIPKPARLPRYVEVTRKSGIFKPDAVDAVNATDLLVTWLRHLLLLSMLQHPSGEWTWGCLVTVHPEGNVDYSDACRRYRNLLTDDSTFVSMTLEDVLEAEVLPARLHNAVAERYIPN